MCNVSSLERDGESPCAGEECVQGDARREGGPHVCSPPGAGLHRDPQDEGEGIILPHDSCAMLLWLPMQRAYVARCELGCIRPGTPPSYLKDGNRM